MLLFLVRDSHKLEELHTADIRRSIYKRNELVKQSSVLRSTLPFLRCRMDIKSAVLGVCQHLSGILGWKLGCLVAHLWAQAYSLAIGAVVPEA